MKRNIISSKVESQNTEDLWLNLVDGNIYFYEYGTWTNVNNVPNRVFNLDIDYTEENLTKFLSPLYEEGFSDDDFPKKVWDKFYETNPGFKLQGERENIRINVMFPKATITQEIEPLLDYNAGYQIFEGNFILNFSEDILGDICNWDFTLKLYKGNTLYYTIDGASGAYVHRTSSLSIEDHINNVSYYKNNGEISLNTFKDLKVQGEVWHVHIKCHYMKETDYDNLGFTILEVLAEKPAIKIASADIKLKLADSTFSSKLVSGDFAYEDSLHNIKYVSGCVSNKLNLVKINEYLGDDIKHLLPAEIDLVLPSDVTVSDTFPTLIERLSSTWDAGYEIMEACMYAVFTKKGYLDIENPYLKYNQLHSPIEVGLYKDRVNKKGTPIDVLCTSNPTELKDVYVDMNVKYSAYPDYWDNINDLDIGTSKHYYFIDTYLSFKYDFKFSDSVHEGHDFFDVFIADLNICLSVETTGGYNIHYFNREEPLSGFYKRDILYTGTSWEDIVKYAKSNYSLSEKTKYKLVYIKAEAESAGVLTDIIIPTPDLKPIEYIHFVGSNDDYATKPNTVTFNDLGIQILYQQSRYATKNCNILDLKTGIEYTLNDLGYSNKAWIPDLLIPEDGNNHYSSGYMLASTFKEILDKFKILNKKHSSIEVDLYDGSNMEQYLGTNYVFNIIKEEDKNKTEIVKLISQTFKPCYYVNPNLEDQTLDIVAGFEMTAEPADITHAMYEELEKEGWTLNYNM